MLNVWRPFAIDRAPTNFDREVDRFFHEFAHDGRAALPARAEVTETESALTVAIELPGVAENDVTVTTENNVLTVKAIRRAVPQPDQKAVVHIAERGYGEISRSFRLPGRIDIEQASARFERGVLTITFPRRAEARTRTIAVNAS